MKPYRPRETQKTAMLDLRRSATFRYDLREIMSHYQVSESVAASVIASIIAKGSRVSIESARTYVLEQEKLGSYSSEVSNEICDLLDRWSRYR